LEIKCLKQDARNVQVSRIYTSKTHCSRCTETRKWTEEFLSRKWLNVKGGGGLARKHYAVLTSIIYRSRKIDKLNSSGLKNEIIHELNVEGTTILTDCE
jgi:hypothetical protein